MRICIHGTGYVGLVTGACLADTGNDVICFDIDADKIGKLSRGIIPIFEPGLEELVRRNVAEGRLVFSTDLEFCLRASQIHFIAVGTPNGDDGCPDIASVFQVAQAIGRSMDAYRGIVIKSTVPVGTADKVRQIIARETDCEFDVVSNPEFLKEGAAVEDFMKPERIVIGTDNGRAGEIMSELYGPFIRTGNPIIFMDNRSAEMTKYAANGFLATKVSFMNEMANLCERTGADIDQVRMGIGSDSRIGKKFLFPGVGYGGSCFPKDVKAIIHTARDAGLNMEILEAVERVNERQKGILCQKVAQHFKGELRGKSIAIWGLSFKPRTDDMREAPSIRIIEGLLEMGARVFAHDPEAEAQAKRIFSSRIATCKTGYDCLKDVDALLIITDWPQFRRPDFERMKQLMKSPVIFDGRNLFEPKKMRDLGFTYFSIGR